MKKEKLINEFRAETKRLDRLKELTEQYSANPEKIYHMRDLTVDRVASEYRIGGLKKRIENYEHRHAVQEGVFLFLLTIAVAAWIIFKTV